MNRGYRTYTEEFKLEALGLLASSGQSAAQLERELGITKGLLLKWRARYQVQARPGETKLVLSDLASAEAEVRRLRRELAVTAQERDILKKAVSIFSKLEG